MNRREFITHSSVIGAGIALLPGSMKAHAKQHAPKARIAFIGVGMRGAGLLKEAVAQGRCTQRLRIPSGAVLLVV